MAIMNASEQRKNMGENAVENANNFQKILICEQIEKQQQNNRTAKFYRAAWTRSIWHDRSVSRQRSGVGNESVLFLGVWFEEQHKWILNDTEIVGQTLENYIETKQQLYWVRGISIHLANLYMWGLRCMVKVCMYKCAQISFKEKPSGINQCGISFELT